MIINDDIAVHSHPKDTVARKFTTMFLILSDIPKKILADLGKTFTSEMATSLKIQINHATLKHPQNIGLVE